MSPTTHPADPARNNDVRIDEVTVLADNWYTLRRVDFGYRRQDGQWTTQQREAYDRGNGATVLLTDRIRNKVLLTKQFRVPAYLNDHPDGMLVEACAGLLDDDAAAEAIRREAEEETGCHVSEVTELFDLFMSPGSVTERVAFFVAEYSAEDRVNRGGGVVEEGEDIEVLELDFAEALAMIGDGRIVDGKTVLLLLWEQLRQSGMPPSLQTPS